MSSDVWKIDGYTIGPNLLVFERANVCSTEYKLVGGVFFDYIEEKMAEMRKLVSEVKDLKLIAEMKQTALK